MDYGHSFSGFMTGKEIPTSVINEKCGDNKTTSRGDRHAVRFKLPNFRVTSGSG